MYGHNFTALKPVDKDVDWSIDLNATILNDYVEQSVKDTFSSTPGVLAVNPFNAKIMLSFMFKPFDVVKAIVESADPKKVKKVMNEYTARVGLSFLHIGAFNPDIRVLEYLVNTAKLHKINFHKLIHIDARDPLMESFSMKDSGKSKHVIFFHNWTALNIAMHLGDTNKIKYLQQEKLTQLSLKSYEGDFRGSLFYTGVLWNTSGVAITDPLKLGAGQFINPRLRMCEMAVELEGWSGIFNYDKNASLGEKIETILKSSSLDYSLHTWLTFFSEKFAKDEEFKNVIAPALLEGILQSHRFRARISYHQTFFTMFAKGLGDNEAHWSSSQVQVISDFLDKIAVENDAPSQQFADCRAIVKTILEKRMLSSVINVKTDVKVKTKI